ncbi:MAG: RimK/LysX family protein [Planctomycetota bacterium]
MPDEPGSLITVGWKERVSLPDWGVPSLIAKIDTGAQTSAIHVSKVEVAADGHLHFEVVTRERPKRRTTWVDAWPVEREAVIKPSSGVAQERRVVKTRLVMGGVEREIEVSLVSRRGMRCRMLIGRSALAGMWSVDPSREFVVSERKRRKAKGGGS